MNYFKSLEKKLHQKKSVIGVIGLGYVGLPLMISAFKSGLNIIGFDIDDTKIKSLKKGESYILHLDVKAIKDMSKWSGFDATSDFSRLKEVDVIVICVPTPLTKNKTPDLQYVLKTTETIAKYIKKGQLIILESTTFPSTTDEIMKNILERDGLKEGQDFFLAFSPEREDPGRKDYTTTTIPKVVGGVSKEGGILAAMFYKQFIKEVVLVKNARTAEATKLLENIFRAVNIGLVNEMKIIYDKMGIDIWEVLDAASTKPFGFMRFNPGPGWGGHCIPLDPFYLTFKAKEYGVSSIFIEHAGEINRRMPEYVVKKVSELLNSQMKCVNGSKILILGIAYKKDIDDPRESPAFEIMRLLVEQKAKVEYYDPHIPKMPKMREWPELKEMFSVKINEKSLKSYDAVIIVTNHSAVDYEMIRKNAKLVIDTRGVYKQSFPKVFKA